MGKFDKSVYNNDYYNTSFGGIPYNRSSHDGHWLKFFNEIATELVEIYRPNKVLDVGCAKGFLVESLRDRNVAAYGFDISEVAISEVREDIKPYCWIGSVDDPIMYEKKYDLIVCIETLEHVSEKMARQAIELMCKHADTVLFSSSPTDFDEPTHINVKPAEYWNELFAENGFSVAHEDWTKSTIAPQALLYRKQEIELIIKNKVELSAEISNQTKEIIERIQNDVDRVQNVNEQIDQKMDGTNLHLQDLSRQLHKMQQRIQGLSKEKELEIQIKKNEISEEELSKLQLDIKNLNQKNNDLLQKEQLLQDQINMINSGTAFKLLRKYWNTRDRLLPSGSKRRATLKRLIRRTNDQSNVSINPTIFQTKENEQEDPMQYWTKGFEEWIKNTELSTEEIERQKIGWGSFDEKPLISILLPVYKIPLNIFKETILSVTQQTYPNWELCIALGNSEDIELSSYINNISKQDERIKFTVLNENKGISLNTNKSLELASGEFIALLDHDDLLTPDALYRMIEAINENTEVDFLYSDKDQINEDGSVRLNPLLKHGWSWPTMLSANYPTHFCVIRKDKMLQVGNFDQTTDGAQDWDMFLKVSEQTSNIVHVPYVLYHWRIISTSVASGLKAKPYVIEAQNRTIDNYLQRKNLNVSLQRIEEDHTFRLHWKDAQKEEYVVIVYDDNSTNEKFDQSVKSVLKQKVKPSKIIIANEKVDVQMHSDVEILTLSFKEILKVLSEFELTSSKILFLQAGAILSNSNSTEELLGWLSTKEFTSVSGLITTPTGKVVNAGYLIDKDNQIIEPFKNMMQDAYTTYGSVKWYRNYLAVSEICLMTTAHHLSEYIHSSYKNEIDISIKDMLFNYQVKTNEAEKKASLYVPYVKVTVEEANSTCKLQVQKLVKDLYYNENVWDWNSSYLKERFEVKASSKQAAPSIWDGYTSDALILAGLYDFSHEDLNRNQEVVSKNLSIDNATSAIWFLPPFSSAFYGGIHTIFRFADYLRKHRGIKNTFVIVGEVNTKQTSIAIEKAFPGLSGSTVLGLSNDKKVKSLPAADMSFCTLWTTAYILLKYNQTKRKFYFLQDWEPLFYPGGTTSAQVEATYEFNFTAICNTISLKQSYEEVGGKAEYFTPSVDNSVFYNVEGLRKNDEFTVFLYGRPGNPRNCFELAIPALRKVKNHFGSKVRIVSAGADWDPAAYDAEGVIEHLGMLPYEKTADLYRKCHIGVAMMMSRHPSYLPFELMACGALVVANDNRWNHWMLKDGENCILSKPSATYLAETIIEALSNHDLRTTIAQNGSEFIKENHSDWDSEFLKLCNKIFVSI